MAPPSSLQQKLQNLINYFRPYRRLFMRSDHDHEARMEEEKGKTISNEDMTLSQGSEASDYMKGENYVHLAAEDNGAEQTASNSIVGAKSADIEQKKNKDEGLEQDNDTAITSGAGAREKKRGAHSLTSLKTILRQRKTVPRQRKTVPRQQKTVPRQRKTVPRQRKTVQRQRKSVLRQRTPKAATRNSTRLSKLKAIVALKETVLAESDDCVIDENEDDEDRDIYPAWEEIVSPSAGLAQSVPARRGRSRERRMILEKSATVIRRDEVDAEQMQVSSESGIIQNEEPLQGQSRSTQNACRKCSKTFPSNSKLKRHVRRVHVKNHQCSTCGQRFSQRHRLNSHISRRHPPKDAKPRNTFACEKCNKCLSSKRTLLIHMVKVCKLKVDSATLKQYSIKIRTCNFCNYFSTSPFDLRRHQFAHTNFKLFACTKCGAEYKSKYNCQLHEKTKCASTPEDYMFREMHQEKVKRAQICYSMRPFKCGEGNCRNKVRFRTEKDLAAHKCLVHRKKKNVPQANSALGSRIRRSNSVIYI